MIQRIHFLVFPINNLASAWLTNNDANLKVVRGL